MEVGEDHPHSKTQQRHRQGHLIQVHIPHLSNCKDTGEEPSSLHNSKHTKQHMQHWYKTLHSIVTELHTLNNTVAKGFYQMAPPSGTSTVALDMSKTFDNIYIFPSYHYHVHI